MHATVAAHDLAGSLVEDEPALASDVLFGACALLELERRAGQRMLTSWRTGRSSLLEAGSVTV